MSYLLNRNRDSYLSDDEYSEDGSDIGSEVDEITDNRNIDSMPDRDITSNFVRVMNIDTLKKIINIIERNMRRPLINNERESVRSTLLNDINVAYNYRSDPTNRFYLGNLENFNTNEIIRKIAHKWIKDQSTIVNRGCMPEIVNVHEMLRKEIGTTAESGTVNPTFVEPLETEPNNKTHITKFLGFCTSRGILKAMNSYNIISHNYIYLDSRLRNISASSGINRFHWDEDNTGSINPGKFSYLGKIRDIIELKIYPFRIPYASDESADTSFRSITIYFEEFANQAFISRGNRRFHIICEASIDGSWINLNPYNSNNGKFRFDKPITEISKLTVSFGSPINLINFDADRLKCTFTIGTPTIITSIEDHNLSTGDIVSFTEYTTLDPIKDASTISFMNNLNGLVIIVLTDTTFSIPVDTTLVTEDPTLSITCIFDSKTFKLPIEFTFIRPETIEE